MISTLVIDCGGGGIKATVLDDSGTMRAQPIRVATPYPLTTKLFIKTLVDLAKKLPPSTHATVGLPGMVRHGVVVATPHYVTVRGPRTRIDPDLVAQWHGFDARTALREAFLSLVERAGKPAALALRAREVNGDANRCGRTSALIRRGRFGPAHTVIRRSGCLARSARTSFSTCAAASSG